jgi:glutaredoxin
MGTQGSNLSGRGFFPFLPHPVKAALPVLYVTRDSAASDAARKFLDGHGISHREVDIDEDTSAREELTRVSGQQKTPALVWEGEVLVDFDVRQLKDFLHEHDVVLEDS